MAAGQIGIERIGQMPEHTAATQPAAFEGRPVDAEPGVPVAGFIEGDGLFVGFYARATQAPVARVLASFNLEDAALANDEVAVGVPVDIAIGTVGRRLQPGEGYRFFILVTGEALGDVPRLASDGGCKAMAPLPSAVN